MNRTARVKRIALVNRFALAFLPIAVLLLASGTRLLAATTAKPLPAHVVWSQGDRIYLAAPDSLKLTPGSRLNFLDKKKPVATGEVLNVFEETFIVAKMTSGSFKKIKHPDRLAVFAEPPLPPIRGTLRMGYPSAKRQTLFFACDSAGIDLPSAGFGAIRSSDHLYQLVHRSDVPDTSSWPDTLVVRFFDDAADEEIALERGEIDAAMFWPGEPSAHIRDKLRWTGEPSGLRQRGIVAGLLMSFHPTVDSLGAAIVTRRVAAKINEDVFRGDLAPCGTSMVDTSAARFNVAMRFESDPDLPGHDVLQRALDRVWKTNTVAKATDLVRITYIDAPLDSITPAIALSGMKRPTEAFATVCLYRIRCPILCSPSARSAVETMGANRIVNLLRCRPKRNAP